MAQNCVLIENMHFNRENRREVRVDRDEIDVSLVVPRRHRKRRKKVKKETQEVSER